MSHKNLLKRCYHNWMFRRLRKRLQLDLAQQQKLEQLKLELESCGTTCQSSRHAQRDDLAQLLEEERLDRERASDMLQTRVNRIESHGQKLLELFAVFSDSLQPFQRRKLQSMLQRRCCCG